MKIEEAKAAIAKILDAVEQENDVWVESVVIYEQDVTRMNDVSPKALRRIHLELKRKGRWV